MIDTITTFILKTSFVLNKDLLDNLDAWTYVVLCPIGIFTSLGLFIGHIFSKELRKSPGDIVMMIALAELILSCHWFSSAIRTRFFTSDDIDPDPSKGVYSEYCKVEAYFAITGAFLEAFYNISFLIYLLLTVIYLNGKRIQTLYFHLIVLGSTGGALTYQILKKNVGRNKYGTCSIVSTSESSLLIGALTIIVVIFLSIYVVVYVKRVLPQHTKELASVKRSFVNFYETYIKMLIFLWTLIFIVFVCQNVGINENDYKRMEPIKYTIRGFLFNLGKLGNISKALTPPLLFYVRLRDPLIKERIWYPFKGTIKRLTGTINPEENKELASELASNTQDLMWVNMLSSKIKQSLHRTLLACIAAYYPESISTVMKSKTKRKRKRTRLTKMRDVHVYRVSARDLMSLTNTSQQQEGEKEGETEEHSVLNCTFTVYEPVLFSGILKSFFKEVDFRESLDIVKNAAKIKSLSESKDGEGGKSGEFFFLSHDRKLILKTTNTIESNIFLNFLDSYQKHFGDLPRSQIGRILGLFEVDFEDAGRSIKLFVMEALDPLHKTAVLRKYDLKGSVFNRRTMSLEDITGARRSTKINIVMKDTDFVKIEKEIILQFEKRRELINSLRLDVKFFIKHRIIDYSLIICVVDKTKLPEGYLEIEKARRNHHVFESQADSTLCYFIGIIDYFQKFNFNKASERLAKMVLKCNTKLDTSSQPPKKYGKRFKQKMREYFKVEGMQDVAEPTSTSEASQKKLEVRELLND